MTILFIVRQIAVRVEGKRRPPLKRRHRYAVWWKGRHAAQLGLVANASQACAYSLVPLTSLILRANREQTGE